MEMPSWERALATLDKTRIRDALAKAERRLQDGGDGAPGRKGRRSTGGKAAAPIAERLDELLASAEVSREAGTPEAMHDQRIAAKRLRYTIELDLDALQ